MSESICAATILIDFDSIWCSLRDGHAGPHKVSVEGGDMWWQKEITRKRDE